MLLAIFLLSFSPAYSAPLPLVKLNPAAANGDCLPPAGGTPAAVLRQSGIGAASPASSVVTSSLARVIGSIARFGSGRFARHRSVTYLFGSEEGFSYHESGTRLIHLNPGAQNRQALRDKRFGGTHNTAVLAHELGHYIAFRDNFAMKRLYESMVPRPCVLTNYAGDPSNGYRNEEFGEVFAAFVTNPSLLRNQGAACEQARAFWARQFEEPLSASQSCESRRVSLRHTETEFSAYP
jgi:hypothetical protein